MATFTVTLPLCAPTRAAVLSGARTQIRADNYPGSAITVNEIKAGQTPLFWRLTVSVSDGQLNWAQYVMARAGYHVEKWHSPQYERQAQRRLQMRRQPEAGAWHEAGCKGKPKDTTIAQARPTENANADPVNWWSARQPAQHNSVIKALRKWW